MAAYGAAPHQPYMTGSFPPPPPPPPPKATGSWCTRSWKVVYAIAILVTAILAIVIPVTVTQTSNNASPAQPVADSNSGASPSPGDSQSSGATPASEPAPLAAATANSSCLRIGSRVNGEDQSGNRLSRSESDVYCDVPFADGAKSGRSVCAKAVSEADCLQDAPYNPFSISAQNYCCNDAAEGCQFFNFGNIKTSCTGVRQCNFRIVDRNSTIWCNVVHTNPDGGGSYLQVCEEIPASEFASCSPDSLAGYPFYTLDGCCGQVSFVGCIDSKCDVRSEDCILPQICAA